MDLVLNITDGHDSMIHNRLADNVRPYKCATYVDQPVFQPLNYIFYIFADCQETSTF